MGAFRECTSLQTITLDSVETIQDNAFMGCKSLKEVTMPDRLTEIKASTFYGCSSLEKIELANVKKIGKDAFKGCNSLTPVDTKGIEVAVGNGKLTK